jgi:hypothetical protein
MIEDEEYVGDLVEGVREGKVCDSLRIISRMDLRNGAFAQARVTTCDFVHLSPLAFPKMSVFNCWVSILA